MASIRLAPIISEVRGSIGGVTFTRGPTGAVARARIKPCEATTNALSQQRALHSVKIEFWRTGLTNAQRIVWNDKAATLSWVDRLGETYTPSGFLLWMRQNQPTPGAPHAWRLTPLDPLVTPAFPLVLTWDEPTHRVDVTTALGFVPPFNGFLHVWYSKSTPPTHYHFSGAWIWSKAPGFQTGVPMDFRLVNLPPVFRPCRMFAKIRTSEHWYTPSAAMVYSISIPADP